MSVIHGDCLEAMAAMEPASVDAVVTDPPYALAFMGREWDRHASPADFQAWTEKWAREAFRVLKPGGHLLAFGGTRTAHRMVSGIEDAGFEIRDTLCWLYGQGFPKSMDVSKAIDKAAGAEREVIAHRPSGWGGLTENERLNDDGWSQIGATHPDGLPITAPATDNARRWNGWGTALKPAHEPVVVARKPLAGTVAANVERHGTGALNIDACRVAANGSGDYDPAPFDGPPTPSSPALGDFARNAISPPHSLGRWPANVALDPEAAGMLDEQAGESRSTVGGPRSGRNGNGWGMRATGAEYDDQGGASRFFYVAKASTRERNAGLEGFAAAMPHDNAGHVHADGRAWDIPGSHSTPRANHHPTVKPVALMRWLVRLVTPPGGMVLDPFAGSGTTGIACALEGFAFTGIEREPEYAAIARVRIAHAETCPSDFDPDLPPPLRPDDGQTSLDVAA